MHPYAFKGVAPNVFTDSFTRIGSAVSIARTARGLRLEAGAHPAPELSARSGTAHGAAPFVSGPMDAQAAPTPIDATPASAQADAPSALARVDVALLAPDLVRVRMIPPFPRPPAGRPSYAVARTDWPTPPFTVEEGPSTWVLTTEAMTVRVETSPVRIAYSWPDGTPFAADNAEGGMGWRRSAVLGRKSLDAEDAIYGMGEKTGYLNHRGRRFTMWNTDVSPHLPDTDPLYASIPFLIGYRRGRAYGLLLDNPFRSRFDLGKGEEDVLAFGAEAGYLDMYVFAGPTLNQVVERYTELTGRMALPPIWALGYHQCRYSYETAEEVLEVARTLRARDLPCDAIYLDIHYMDGYRVFTFHPERFSDPRAMTNELRNAGFRTVSIVDPGIAFDPDDPLQREGSRRGFWAVRADGRPYVGRVWPGEVTFPDFTRPEVRSWWASQHRTLFDAGIDGVWNDMNEPADFDGPDKTLPPDVFFGTEAQPLTHGEVHNVYGQLMAEATQEAFATWRPGVRPFIISRAGYAGIQRHAVMWTGDNSSWWDHLLMSVPMALNMGLSGIPFVGADVGGFLGDCDGELLARWMQLGAFMPFYRNHSVLGSRRQEPYAFGEPYESICRRYLKLRYRLIPYMYTLVHEASVRGTPILRPMVWEFPDDPKTPSLFDQFMLGPHLLVAPVYQPKAENRQVYLPAGGWIDYWTGRAHPGGRAIVAEAPVNTIPLLLRAGAIVPYGREMAFTTEKPQAIEYVDIAPPETGASRFSLYVDDGQSLNYRQGHFGWLDFECSTGTQGISIRVHRRSQDPFTVTWPVGTLRIHSTARPGAVLLNGSRLEELSDSRSVTAGSPGWVYDATSQRLYVGLHRADPDMTVRIEL